jgi:hypothetical protein
MPFEKHEIFSLFFLILLYYYIIIKYIGMGLAQLSRVGLAAAQQT